MPTTRYRNKNIGGYKVGIARRAARLVNGLEQSSVLKRVLPFQMWKQAKVRIRGTQPAAVFHGQGG